MIKKTIKFNPTLLFFICLFLVVSFSLNKLLPKTTDKNTNKNQPENKTLICERKIPYKMEPEFERALSLLNQRSKSISLHGYDTILNCIDIQYGDLQEIEAEGVFLFDNNSTKDDLKIIVDKRYKSYDDILTMLLLSHEIVHASQFLHKSTLDCYEKEIQAFTIQIQTFPLLNSEEIESVYYRVNNNPEKNSAYLGLHYLFTINTNANKICGGPMSQVDVDSMKYSKFNDCFFGNRDKMISEMVRNSSGYQKQCADNQ